MPEFSRFKLEVGQLFWDGGSTSYVQIRYCRLSQTSCVQFVCHMRMSYVMYCTTMTYKSSYVTYVILGVCYDILQYNTVLYWSTPYLYTVLLHSFFHIPRHTHADT